MLRSIFLPLIFCFAVSTIAADAPIKHRLLLTEYGKAPNRFIELDADGKMFWEFSEKDAPELNLTWISSLQQLANGNLLLGNFIRGQEGKGAHAFEITRDKQVVWKWEDHALIKSLTTVRVIGE